MTGFTVLRTEVRQPIMRKHNITCSETEVMQMTVKQWKWLVENKFKETVNRETHEKCRQKTKQQEITDDARLKKYLKCLTWDNARTVFEVRTNMLKLNSNYGQKDETSYMWKNKTKHIFKCKGSKEYDLTTAKYTELTKRGGPQDKMKSVEKTAEAVRHYYTKDRAQTKEITEKYG